MFGIKNDRHGTAMNEESSILSSLRIYLLLAKIFGIFGCSITGERVKKSSLSSKIYCFSWILLLYYYIGYTDLKTTNFVKIFTRGINELSDRNIEKLATVGGEVFVSIFQQRKIIRFFDKMDDYDRRVRNLGFRRKDNTTIYWIMSLFPVFFILVKRIYNIYSDDKYIPLIWALLSYYYYILQYFIVMKFCMFVHLIYQRFRYLNNCVTTRVFHGSVIHRQQSVTIYDVRYLHTKLCEAGESLADVYSLWLLLWFAQIATTFTRCFMLYLSSGFINDHVPFVVAWLICLCWNCGNTSNEASKTMRKLLQERPLSGDTADITDRIEMVMYLFNHDLNFTVFRIYVINRSFLIQMMGILLTYVTYQLD